MDFLEVRQPVCSVTEGALAGRVFSLVLTYVFIPCLDFPGQKSTLHYSECCCRRVLGELTEGRCSWLTPGMDKGSGQRKDVPLVIRKKNHHKNPTNKATKPKPTKQQPNKTNQPKSSKPQTQENTISFRCR